MAMLVERAGMLWEANFPIGLAFLAGVATFAFGPKAFACIIQNSWKVDVVYSSVFDIVSIFTAFLMTFYTLVITTDRGFIGRAKDSRPYRSLLAYTIRALGLGSALILLSVPIMLVEPAPTSHSDPSLYAVAIWCALSVWTAAAFVRAAHLFAIFAKEHA